jgi:hypothetical protein
VLLASLGIALLANSRPFEGGLTIIACALVLVWWRRRETRPFSELLRLRVLVAAVLVLAPAAAAMAYYNYRLTGSATLLPYVVNERRYASSPRFYLAGPITQPVYNHEYIRRNWDWDRALYEEARRNPLSPVVFASDYAGHLWVFGFWMVGLTGLIFGARPRVLAALAILVLPLIGIMLEKAFLPHYLAPIAAAYLILPAALLEIGDWQSKRLLSVVALSALGIFAFAVYRSADAAKAPATDMEVRPVVIRKLQAKGMQHLVLVRYSPQHSVYQEWVYNHADIDGSDIVWARDMGPDKNQELLDYYPARKVWLLEPDRGPIRLVPYLPVRLNP